MNPNTPEGADSVWVDLLDDYRRGTLTPEHMRDVEAQLAADAELRAELASRDALAAELRSGLDSEQPDAAQFAKSRESLMARLRTEALPEKKSVRVVDVPSNGGGDPPQRAIHPRTPWIGMVAAFAVGCVITAFASMHMQDIVDDTKSHRGVASLAARKSAEDTATTARREDEPKAERDKDVIRKNLSDAETVVPPGAKAVRFHASDGLVSDRQQLAGAASEPASPAVAEPAKMGGAASNQPRSSTRAAESKKQDALSSSMEIGSGAELQQSGMLSPRADSVSESVASAALDSRDVARPNTTAPSAAPKRETTESEFQPSDDASGRAGEQRSLALSIGNSISREEAATGLRENFGVAHAPQAIAARPAQDAPAAPQGFSRRAVSAIRKSKDSGTTVTATLERQNMIAAQLRVALALQREGRTTESAELLTVVLRKVQDDELQTVATTRSTDEATTPQ